jgi:hypothetical protein
MKVDAANSKSVDLLNIGLIFLSLVAALKIPFQLFLFSYAVLGPMHYITEINWLNEKSYFVKERKWVWVFVVMAVLFSLPMFVELPSIKANGTAQYLANLFTINKELFFSIISFSILFAVTLVYIRKPLYIALLSVLNLAINFCIYKFNLFSLAFIGVFVPTVLHVYLFTLLFMLYGALKSKNIAGYIGCAFLALCPLLIWKTPIDADSFVLSDSLQKAFTKSSFSNVTTGMADVLGLTGNGEPFYLLSEAALKLQIFLAFGYTYHYLNWFSKTSIIGWSKNISRPKLALLVLVWLASVALYWYDYQIGLTALLIMSMIHVLFEFPLNVISVQGIVESVLKRSN